MRFSLLSHKVPQKPNQSVSSCDLDRSYPLYLLVDTIMPHPSVNSDKVKYIYHCFLYTVIQSVTGTACIVLCLNYILCNTSCLK